MKKRFLLGLIPLILGMWGTPYAQKPYEAQQVKMHKIEKKGERGDVIIRTVDINPDLVKFSMYLQPDSTIISLYRNIEGNMTQRETYTTSVSSQTGPHPSLLSVVRITGEGGVSNTLTEKIDFMYSSKGEIVGCTDSINSLEGLQVRTMSVREYMPDSGFARFTPETVTSTYYSGEKDIECIAHVSTDFIFSNYAFNLNSDLPDIGAITNVEIVASYNAGAGNNGQEHLKSLDATLRGFDIRYTHNEGTVFTPKTVIMCYSGGELHVQMSEEGDMKENTRYHIFTGTDRNDRRSGCKMGATAHRDDNLNGNFENGEEIYIIEPNGCK